jgi:hypothetical protein
VVAVPCRRCKACRESERPSRGERILVAFGFVVSVLLVVSLAAYSVVANL